MEASIMRTKAQRKLLFESKELPCFGWKLPFLMTSFVFQDEASFFILMEASIIRMDALDNGNFVLFIGKQNRSLYGKDLFQLGKAVTSRPLKFHYFPMSSPRITQLLSSTHLGEGPGGRPRLG